MNQRLRNRSSGPNLPLGIKPHDGARSDHYNVKMVRQLLSFILILLPYRLHAGESDAFTTLLNDGGNPILTDALRSQWTRRIQDRLGPFDAVLRQEGDGLGAMASSLIAGIASGRYDSLILGESHGEKAEQDAAKTFLRGLASSPAKVAAVIFEETQTSDGSVQYIFQDTAWLTQAGIAVLGYKDHFNPEQDVKAALKTAGKDVLISYTGSAHSARRVKDYVLYTIDDRLGPYGRGGRDMVTIEDVFRKHHRRPLIVSMVSESFILDRIQGLLLDEIGGSQKGLEAVRSALDAAADAWKEQFASYPAVEGIRFRRFPGQDDLYAGLTAGERRPLQLSAVAEVLRSQDFEQWLGSGKIKSLNAGQESSRDASGRVIEADMRVSVRDQKGRAFERRIPITL